jgi:hypothetical protein
LSKLLYEKGTGRVLFKCFLDSQNMKNPEFSIFGLVKKHRKTHTGLNHSFLGFVKHTPRDLMKDELTSTSICYPPQDCVKIKRYSPEMVGGNLGKKRVFVFVLVAVIVALEHDTPLHHLNPG